MATAPPPNHHLSIDGVFREPYPNGVIYIAHCQLKRFAAVDVPDAGTARELEYEYDEFELAQRQDDWTPIPASLPTIPDAAKNILETALQRRSSENCSPLLGDPPHE